MAVVHLLLKEHADVSICDEVHASFFVCLLRAVGSCNVFSAGSVI